tara:strand:- start:2747 stop:4381 length:1635 start_codon:yes stop_codon:yes gene_type:complete
VKSRQPVRDVPVVRSGRRESLALWVFIGYLVLAGLLILFRLGSYHWFFGDEWSFLAERDGFNLQDLFRSHGEHWVTLPIISYRILYSLFGLHSYLPYQAVLVASHLACAGLLRIVMRRAGVGPWVATLVASVFVLLGPGEENIVWAFQITLVFALMFGMCHLVLSDHDGLLDRRDWFGLLAGLAGLMSSGLSLVMIPVVGLAVFIRRGWRLALFHTAPLGAVYLVWLLLSNPEGIPNPYGRSATISEIITFVWSGVLAGLQTIGGSLGNGLLLSVVLLIGLALIGKTDSNWRRIGTSAALFTGALMFLAGSSYSRWYVAAVIDQQSRYLYLLVAFGLPLCAVAADAIISRWRPLAPLILLPFGVALVLNLDGFGARAPWTAAYHQRQQETILLMAHSDLAQQVPGDVRPNIWFTIGWLREALRANKVPSPPVGAESWADELPLLLVAAQRKDKVSGKCSIIAAGTILETRAGEIVGFKFDVPPAPETPFFEQNVLVFERIGDAGSPIGFIGFSESFGATLEFAVDGLRLAPHAASPSQKLLLCR